MAIAPAAAKLAGACRFRTLHRGRFFPDRASPCRCTLKISLRGARCLFIELDRSDSNLSFFTEEERGALLFLSNIISDEFRRRLKKIHDQAQYLTRREREIAGLIIHGLSNRAVAASLGISEATVKKHLYNVFNKTGAESRAHLVALLRDTRAS
jgi:DNA-binding CsgD family transcriptional regulator